MKKTAMNVYFNVVGGVFLEMRLLGSQVSAYVVLLGITKIPSRMLVAT